MKTELERMEKSAAKTGWIKVNEGVGILAKQFLSNDSQNCKIQPFSELMELMDLTGNNMNRTKPDIMQLIRFAESLDSKVSEDSREALQGLVNQGEGISILVTYYIHNRSPLALELLCHVKEPYDTELCSKIQDFLAKNTLAALTLLGQVVQKTPSWLPKLAEHSIFDHILKFIRPSENIVVVVSAILLISSLLPHFAAVRKSTLLYLFRTLIMVCNMLYKFKKLFDKQKQDIIEGIYVSHLYSAVIQYFIVLYGIYPANMVEYLRIHVNAGEARALSVLEALFCAVKFHPNILKMTAEQELDRSRWSQREAHDFLADCRHVLVRSVLPAAAVKANKLVASSRTLDMSSSAMSYISQLPDLRSLFSAQTNSSSSDSQDTSFDHWNEDSAWLEGGKDFVGLLESRSDSLGNRVTDVIISSSTGSNMRRATAGAMDLKHIRRPSFTQKINDFIRRRKTGTLSDEPLLHTSPFPRTLLDATREDAISDEPIEEIFVREDTRKPGDEMGQIEEAVDAREICSSFPFPRTEPSEKSFANTPATIVPLEDMHLAETETATPSASEILRTPEHVPSCLAPSSSATRSYRQSASFDGDTDSVRYRKVKELKINENEEPSGRVSVETFNRFSVTSFFRKVNRQRFISECTREQRGMIQFRGQLGSPLRSQLSRITSCPNLLHSSKFADPEMVADLNDLKRQESMANRNLELSVEEIEELIAQKCPYLPFLRTLPFPFIDEESLDMELKCEHERTRRNYIEASGDYHTCLKQLSLADRLPAKIYDDMSQQLKGLPSETQVKVLNTRLALVNQHLLYERCGRLLHAERNRRLFGRLKQQKSTETEKMSLCMALHNAHVEREQLISALTDWRRRDNFERSRREEMERRFCEEIKTSRNEAHRYFSDLENLKLEMKSVTEMNSHRQVELEMYKRRCEDAEMKLLFAETKLDEMGTLKLELKNAHQNNQRLRDEISQLNKRLEGEGSAPRSQITPVEYDASHLIAEIMRLKSAVVQEHNAKEIAKGKAREFEDELMLERRRCGEFSALLERAKKVHCQQCEAAQHKYLSLLSVCQKQQSHILDLYAKIEEVAAAVNSRTTMIIEPHTLFPSSSINEMYHSSGSSQVSFFPSELFEEENTNNAPSSDTSNANNGDTVVSSAESYLKYGVPSLSS